MFYLRFQYFTDYYNDSSKCCLLIFFKYSSELELGAGASSFYTAPAPAKKDGASSTTLALT